MNKSRKKQPANNGYDANRASAVKWTAAKFGCTPEYVRLCDNAPEKTSGDRAQHIRKAMRAKYAELTCDPVSSGL